MATKRTKRKTIKRTKRAKKKGNGRCVTPKGFVILSKDAAKSLMKSAKALNVAVAHMVNAETLNNRALRRAKM